jgi:hypothetical protein
MQRQDAIGYSLAVEDYGFFAGVKSIGRPQASPGAKIR